MSEVSSGDSRGWTTPTRPPRRRRLLGLLVWTPLLLVVLGLGPILIELVATNSQRHSTVAEVPDAPVAIVLGAGLDGAGRPSPFLALRLDAAIDLYRAGTVRALLMSGDNSTSDYDEVEAMSHYALAHGVPSAAVVSDHAGFDTYSSCYRAKSVWGIDHAVIVTQAFHLPRAVWLCNRLGVQTSGLVASDGGSTSTSDYGWLREIPAAAKANVDLIVGRVPTFPGPREHTLDPVTGNH